MRDSEIKILTSEYRKISIPDKFVELDLGCGKGSFTTSLAEKYPERYIIAADVMLGRLRKLNNRAHCTGLNNIELLRVEAGSLVNYFIPPASVDRIHILCPDPWPKKKHKGHRLLSSEFIGRVAVILKKNGIFHFSTDDKTYFSSATKVVETSGLFAERNLSLIDDVREIKTDFERLWESKGKTVNHAAWKML